ncbi:hypothetical protein NDU88_009872 [Pleurodeles waltl]|uniref:Uncharacterized protein n=1 Tax=Pleurodeles waltl TaxID=8319 RepID=A0AAV7RZJ3_PLEWA|nr:hypothetical protein NDU88_009872 [Pleurodeles waltl]
MGWHRQAASSQGNTREQYTTPTPLPQCQTCVGGPGEVLGTPATVEEPLRAELLAAMQGSRVALKGKIETVAVEEQGRDLKKGVAGVEGQALCHEHQIYFFVSVTLEGTLWGKSHIFEHPEEVWRWLEMWDKDAPGRSGRSGLVATRASDVDGSDWQNHGESQMQASAQRGVSSDSRIEIQQDGTMAVVVPELAAKLTVAPDQEMEMISVDT